MTTDILEKVQPVSAAANIFPVGKTISLSINRGLINKNQSGNKAAFKHGWCSAEATIEEFTGAINTGFAFSAQFKDEIRNITNFIRAGFLAADIDGTMSWDDAHNNEWVKQYATFIYTTPSHDPDGEHRFRIVFATAEPIESAISYRMALLGLATLLDADKSATDPARLFYGSSNSHPIILGHQLSKDALEDLIARGSAATKKAAEIEKDARYDIDDNLYRETSMRANTIARDMPIRLANGTVSVLADIPIRSPVHCPIHADKRPSAFVLQSKKGKHPGIHCSSCQKTFWLEGTEAPKYDFYRFEKLARKQAAILNDPLADEPFPDGPIREAKIINEKYLPKLDLVDGITLVRSPKGTGKTEQLMRIVGEARMWGKSVLLIGHRQTLLREISKRLGMHCYLDDEDDITSFGKPSSKKKKQRPKLYAVSIDSLPSRLKNQQQYDVVLIDESEQVLSHATAKTVKKPHKVMQALQRYITSAPAIYLFDADLNNITYDFVTECRKINQGQNVRVVVNEYVDTDRKYDLYDDAVHLTHDLVTNVKAGKRVFVACNSKRHAKTLHKLLQKDVGDHLKSILITAEEKSTEQVAAFLANVKKEILKYDVVVASPAIGTGIDITFPDNAALVDIVYGFFGTRINSHYDCDQQIGRVRNPGEVKIWMSPEKFGYEIDPAAIKLDLIETGDMASIVRHYDKYGKPDFDETHPVLCLVANVYCAQRASQNQLRRLFIAHKKHNGWKANRIKPPAPEEVAAEAELSQTNAKIEQSRAEVEQEHIDHLMSAAKITKERYWELKFEQDKGQPIGVQSVHEIQRYEIETFYQEDISAELITFDDYGTMRESIVRFDCLEIFGATKNLLQSQWQAHMNGAPMHGTMLPGRVLEMVLFSTGLVIDTGLDASRVFSKNDLQTFVTFCKKHEIMIQRKLDILLRKDIVRDPVKTLNRFLDLIGLVADPAGTKKKNGAKIYMYQIEPEQFRRVDGFRQKYRVWRMAKYDTEERDWIPRQKSKSKERRQAASSVLAQFFI